MTIRSSYRLLKCCYVAGLVTALVFAIATFLIDWVPPLELTQARQAVIAERVILFVKERGRVPEAHEGLPPVYGKDNSTSDAWGNPFQVVFSGDNVVITSFGADGALGGINENKDLSLTRSFEVIQRGQGKRR